MSYRFKAEVRTLRRSPDIGSPSSLSIAHLLGHRPTCGLGHPSFKLGDRHQALAPSPDQPQFRRHLSIEEVRADTDRGGRLGDSA
jgi:hypothetical protein